MGSDLTTIDVSKIDNKNNTGACLKKFRVDKGINSKSKSASLQISEMSKHTVRNLCEFSRTALSKVP